VNHLPQSDAAIRDNATSDPWCAARQAEYDTASEQARQTRGLKSGLTTEEITALRVGGFEGAGKWNALGERS